MSTSASTSKRVSGTSSVTSRMRLANVGKRFGALIALDDVTLEVAPGEVHGLLGENGAGKSTFLNILSGVLRSDSGSLSVDGVKLDVRNPLDARAAGIAMIHQELQHVPELTVAQNMFLGRPLTSLGGLWVKRRAQERRAKELLAELDPAIDPSTPIRHLKVAQRQLVEIARALLEDARVIAMDEPTSSLTPSEFERLAELIVTLSKRGVAIIYVSHKMNEIFRLCSRATILRDGKMVDVVTLADTTEAQVTAQMVGRELATARHRSYATQEPMLRVESLGRKSFVRDVSFTLHKGEVLGISGLVGAGRTELVRLIAGVDRADTGSVHLHGKEIPAADPPAAIRAGLGLLPEERKRDGIVPGRSIASNIALPSMRHFARSGLLRRGELFSVASELTREMQLRPDDVTLPISKLSGGNQQKAIIARWLAASTDVLLFDEPTRGIDVGAKAEIYTLIEKLAMSGKAVVVVSSEMPELIRVSDRVLVMCEGRVTAELAGDDINESELLRYAIPESQMQKTQGAEASSGL